MQKIPKKLSEIGYPANTDIAPESSKREGYFSGPPIIKFQNTGKHTEACHTHILLVKISKNPDGRDGTDGQADFAHSNVKGASAKIPDKLPVLISRATVFSLRKFSLLKFLASLVNFDSNIY